MKVWTKEERVLLGLSQKEGFLIDTLSKLGTCNTSVLAYESSLPRVTVMRMLKALMHRGFVSRREKSKEVMWSLVERSALKKNFKSVLDNSKSVRTHVNFSEVGSLTVYHGFEEIVESNRKMLVAHAGERVLAIEPNGIWRHFSKVQASPVHELNLLWKEKKILIEMVAEEGFEKILKNQVDSNIEESFLSLATDIRVVPKGMLDSTTEVLIFRDQILFTDWEHLTGVEIKNPSTMRVMKAMYRVLQASGRNYRSS